MVVLRCTLKLLVRLKQAGDLPAVESTTRLGDWYGNVLQIGRRQHLLFISERSRLPVVLPITESKHLGTVFPDAVCERLSLVGIELLALLVAFPDEPFRPDDSSLQFIDDAAFRRTLSVDIAAAHRALMNGEWKAATVLAGSVIA